MPAILHLTLQVNAFSQPELQLSVLGTGHFHGLAKALYSYAYPCKQKT